MKQSSRGISLITQIKHNFEFYQQFIRHWQKSLRIDHLMINQNQYPSSSIKTDFEAIDLRDEIDGLVAAVEINFEAILSQVHYFYFSHIHKEDTK